MRQLLRRTFRAAPPAARDAVKGASPRGRCLQFLSLAGAAVLAAFLGLAVPAQAEVPLPEIAKAKGGNCVEEPALMRRDHMEFLKHQRDDTMRLGIRTSKHSLKGCIACHAVDGPDGKPVSTASPQHFCRSCHEYAAVKPDCFQCHTSVPGEDEGDAGARTAARVSEETTR